LDRGRCIRIAYYALTDFLILLVLFQAASELEISYAETTHRLTIYTTMKPNVFSRELDKLAAIILSFSLGAYQLLTLRRRARDLWVAILPPSLMLLASLTLCFLNLSTLSMLAVLLSTLLYLKLSGGFREYANSTIAFLVALETASLARWLTYPFVKTDFYADPSWIPPKVEKSFFDLVNVALSPSLATVLVFSWTAGMLLKIGGRVESVKLGKDGMRLKMKGSLDEGAARRPFANPIQGGFGHQLLSARVALPLSILCLFYLAYYPYVPSVNPTGKWASVDIAFYSAWLEKFESLGLNAGGLDYLLRDSGNRPVVMLTLFSVRSVLNLSPVEAIKLSYFIAGSLLVLSTYCSLKIATGSEILSASSAYLTAFSIATVVGLYAGYLASWMSASFLILMASFLSKAVEDKRYSALVPATILSALALYSHPWSWFIFALASVLLLPLNALLSRAGVQRRYDRRQAGIVFAFALANALMDASKELLLGSTGGAASDYGMAQGLRVCNLFLYGKNLNYMLGVFVGGFTSNWLVFLLSVVGAAFALKYDNGLLSTLLLLLLITSPAFPLSDHSVQSRIIYFLPLHILSTIGLLEALKMSNRWLNARAAFALTTLVLANYSFRSVANLV
jgi:hypothetical protein